MAPILIDGSWREAVIVDFLLSTNIVPDFSVVREALAGYGFGGLKKLYWKTRKKWILGVEADYPALGLWKLVLVFKEKPTIPREYEKMVSSQLVTFKGRYVVSFHVPAGFHEDLLDKYKGRVEQYYLIMDSFYRKPRVTRYHEKGRLVFSLSGEVERFAGLLEKPYRGEHRISGPRTSFSELDLRILELLYRSATISAPEIARRLGVTANRVRGHIRLLRKHGVIRALYLRRYPIRRAKPLFTLLYFLKTKHPVEKALRLVDGLLFTSAYVNPRENLLVLATRIYDAFLDELHLLSEFISSFFEVEEAFIVRKKEKAKTIPVEEYSKYTGYWKIH